MSASRPGSRRPTVRSFLVCDRAAEVIDFVVATFGARVRTKMVGPAGNIAQAELRIGNTEIMLGEPDKEMRKRLKPKPAHLFVLVSNVHATYRRALAAGGTSFSKPIGPRLGAVNDPSGNFWWIANPVTASPRVVERRHRAYLEKQARLERADERARAGGVRRK